MSDGPAQRPLKRCFKQARMQTSTNVCTTLNTFIQQENELKRSYRSRQKIKKNKIAILIGRLTQTNTRTKGPTGAQSVKKVSLSPALENVKAKEEIETVVLANAAN